MKNFFRFFYTIYFLVGAFIYIVVYGSIVLFIGFLVGLFNKNLSRRFVIHQIEVFGRMAFRLLGIKVHVFGEKPNLGENFIVVANHQSALDIPLIIGYVAPVAFIAKRELGKVPGINWYLKYLGSVLIDRGNVRKTAMALKQVVEKLKFGVHFIIFPEGTRSHDGNVLEFKKKSLEIAFKYKVKILPVSIWGVHKVLRKKSLMLNRYPVYIKIHELVDPSLFESEEDLRNHVRNIIIEGVKMLERRNFDEKS
ncbi:acyl-phosphate glycerol 3-phosphate acyltransferase [Thermosipho melanesiensis]|uniref:1-acyl-sn-glycerol-3-phosphate acyltransferase n=2 Tax=Thermosipho melanesiensis TaxID=46541 RepID=A6LJA5_THEM4|nr:lysophospholipid acyltransferase family protein [Thermosipho melanesiensis]ABR30006.1 1-acyl-sn-glycerol-3-phosphate acyltransferase [Thermosipho melanesiensis BI429]APT73210.1 acyl-phosphate glycerol 3-phosphate acyltransferase [Thermosipho melanesiensis]OOC38604.1 acyl-phosphate glycerol 3-phosphate acyltransferase [Thermosipho melanesiensis]OOC40408.1 acyl-phosphate glycerol 3-phosphate acyltransferase [Thermosipho melanesiensis]OOC40672.1 acyl-phosphate glycerol 3-phosphate acyltransfer